uniref:C2H2-type domain-containing protein n=1 Tax=Salmo trutta TaxID=8032 RepID=A0A673YCF0_SALTR
RPRETGAGATRLSSCSRFRILTCISPEPEDMTVKMEGDIPLTWNADSHLGDRHSQGRDFLDYRESLETIPNNVTHSPLHTLRDRDPVSTSMGPSDSHSLFDQVLNSNDSARAQAQGGRATSDSSKEKRFLCMFCSKGFSCPQKVEIHQRFHTGVKPFSCNQCHMSFAQAGDLKRHQRVHTGEKPYSCPQCEKRFSRLDKLKMHLKVHTGERPFACTHCRKRFSERSYLRIHQNNTFYCCQQKRSTDEFGLTRVTDFSVEYPWVEYCIQTLCDM